jgi:SAM-dependent methyltransferase
MLHFAPERAFMEPLSRYIGDGYITADLYNDAMAKVDITDIKFPNDSFDVIYCCHVLEHIVDDVKAIQELGRVLKKSGWALIVVPIPRARANTFEDKSVTKPADRLRIYGQADHVRICGIDYVERLKNNGFMVTVYDIDQVASKDEQIRFGLRDTTLYYCTKNGDTD